MKRFKGTRGASQLESCLAIALVAVTTIGSLQSIGGAVSTKLSGVFGVQVAHVNMSFTQGEVPRLGGTLDSFHDGGGSLGTSDTTECFGMDCVLIGHGPGGDFGRTPGSSPGSTAGNTPPDDDQRDRFGTANSRY